MDTRRLSSGRGGIIKGHHSTDKALTNGLQASYLPNLQDLEAQPTGLPTGDGRLSSVSSKYVYSGRGGAGNAQAVLTPEKIEEILKNIGDPSKLSGDKRASFSGRGGFGNFGKKKNERGKTAASEQNQREADMTEEVDEQLKHPERAYLGSGVQGDAV
ncbi:MAG: hypothetical protein MMC33_001449 [Icmadophila ericetorum]|nr:hypothetical protein [Icmadophila ericetorum]